MGELKASVSVIAEVGNRLCPEREGMKKQLLLAQLLFVC